MIPERPPWLLRADRLEACDERGECPDCGDPIPECWCPEPAERWLPVVGWEGLYEVSDFGRVRSIKGGRSRPLKHEILNGYHRAALSRANSSKKIFVHRLVLSAFVGPCPEGMEACHNDGNRQNNAVSNLRWDTAKANSADRDRHGTTARGESGGASVLTEVEVLAIRLAVASGERPLTVAERFGIAPTTMWSIVKGRTWKHVSEGVIP